MGPVPPVTLSRAHPPPGRHGGLDCRSGAVVLYPALICVYLVSRKVGGTFSRVYLPLGCLLL